MRIGWHFVLTLFGSVIFGLAWAWVIHSGTLCSFTPPLAAFASVVMTTLVLFALHGWNESQQAIDPDLVKKYGNWKAFVKDSRADWREFYIGLFLGIFVFLIVYLFIW